MSRRALSQSCPNCVDQIRGVPGLELVFRTNGLGNADQALIDDGVENLSESDAMDTNGGNDEKEEEQDEIHVEQICLANVGEYGASRPYLSVHIFGLPLEAPKLTPFAGSVLFRHAGCL
jgi:hypothetical protein